MVALLGASEAKKFDVVLVDDLSRLARDNYLMLSPMAELHFNGVRVVSVADGLDTGDEEAKLGIKIRGIAQFIREWGGPTSPAAIAARQRADALLCVALFLANRSAPAADKSAKPYHYCDGVGSGEWRRGESPA